MSSSTDKLIKYQLEKIIGIISNKYDIEYNNIINFVNKDIYEEELLEYSDKPETNSLSSILYNLLNKDSNFMEHNYTISMVIDTTRNYIKQSDTLNINEKKILFDDLNDTNVNEILISYIESSF